MRTLGTVALLLQQADDIAAPAVTETASTANLFRIIAGSSPIAQAILAILIIFSIVSWAVFLYKLGSFRKGARQSAQFLDVFRRSSKFSEVQAVCRSLTDSPLVGLFQAGYAELTAQLRQQAPDPAHPPAGAPRPTLKSVAAVDRALLRATALELGKLERLVPILATTANVTPFIGLLGTVIGIMMAFQSIGETGSTNFGIVGPSIAEALVATGAGLFAAIPAVMFYNYLTNRVKTFAAHMDDFAMEFLNIAERNFT